jgi:uncharacterized membrane protein
MYLIVAFLIALLAITASTSIISSNVYRTLKTRENPFAFVLGMVCFIVIFVIMWAVLLSVWAAFTGGFSRI